MKSNKLSALLVVALLLPGCKPAENRKSTQANDNDATTETMPEPAAEDRYIADFAQMLDEIIEVVALVSDQDNALVALNKLKQLEPRAEALGQRVEELKAAASDPEASEDLVGYLQENGKTKLDARLQTLQEKLGKSRDSSEYPELWQSAVELINKAKSN